MHWLLQLVASCATLLLGPWPWTGGPLLIGFLFLSRAASKMLALELVERPRLALATCLLGQAPGLALALFVAACMAGLFGEALDSMVLLQLWTAIWAALLSLVPLVAFRNRGAYVWVTLALPFVQLAWAVAPLLRSARPHASETLAAATGATGSRPWTRQD
jgi:hypothetical protein